jgi:DNA repair photolyase
LTRELRRSTWSRELVAVGTATDPYQPIEGHYRLTRQCLEALVEGATPFSIVTKGPMVVRDLDILRRATQGAGCQVFVSVPSVDARAWARLEPGTAPPEQRLRAARQLTDAGIDTAVMMMPLVPGITTSRSSIRATVQAIERAGLRFAGVNVAHLEAGVREHFMAFLGREYPALVAGYERLYPRAYAPADYCRQVRTTVDEERGRAREALRNRPAAESEPRPTTGSEPSGRACS